MEAIQKKGSVFLVYSPNVRNSGTSLTPKTSKSLMASRLMTIVESASLVVLEMSLQSCSDVGISSM